MNTKPQGIHRDQKLTKMDSKLHQNNKEGMEYQFQQLQGTRASKQHPKPYQTIQTRR